MTQNKASGIIYKLQPNTSSHYLQKEVTAEDTETGLKEFMLTLGLSVNSGCAGTKLFTKDWSYTSHKGLLSQAATKGRWRVLPCPSEGTWSSPRTPIPPQITALQLAHSREAQRPLCKAAKKGDWELYRDYGKDGRDVVWHWAGHAEITMLFTAHGSQHRYCYSCWILQTVTTCWWKAEMETLSNLNVLDSK